MDQQKRLMVALMLSFAMVAAYTLLFPQQPPVEPPAGAPADAGQTAAPADAGVAAAAPAAPAPVEPPPAEAPAVREIARKSEEVALTWSSQGAGLTQAQLLGEKMREQPQVSIAEGYRRLFGGAGPKAPPMDMAAPMTGAPLPLAVSIQGPRPFSPSARYRVEESNQGRVLTFTAREGATEVTKIFELPAEPGLEMKMTVVVKNLGAEPLGGELGLHYARGVVPGTEEQASLFGGVGNESHASCSVGEDMENLPPTDKPPSEFRGQVNFVGVNQQYFLGALFPLEGPREGRCVLESTQTGRAATAFFPIQVAPGQEVRQSYGVYIGPKELEVLRTVPERMKALGLLDVTSAKGTEGWSAQLDGSDYPHLDRAVDFGIWAVICRVLLPILKFFHSISHNWGVAIILLTVLVKLVLLPLTHKSMVSAEAMKKLQPKVEELRKKFASDRERQNVEMMKLYQEAKVNPLGGCLPILLQLPVWGALFMTLRSTYELYREPFISPLWTDLTYKDPTYLLPLALGVTMIVTQKLQPQMMDATQAKIMTWVMPIFFTAIMVNYPAGLTLYIFTNNVLSIGQQYLLRRYLEKKGIATPMPAKTEKPRRVQNERQPGRK